MAAADHLRPCRGWFFKGETKRAFQSSRLESLDNSVRQRVKMSSHCVVGYRLQCRIETAHRAIDEAVHLIRSAEKLAPALPFRDHLLRLKDVLRKPGSRAALTLLGVAPA